MSPDETDVEQLGRDAANARMASLPPLDEEAALSRIRSELASSGSPHRPFVFGAVAAAVVLIVVLAVVFTRSDDTTKVITPATDTTTTAPTTTVLTGPTAPQFAGLPVWPFSGGMASPSAAAESFATDYLGMASPSVDANGSLVTVRVRGQGAPVVVTTQQTAGGWVVMSASSDQIVVDLQDGEDAPQSVRGQSGAFEATINIEVRPFGSLTPSEETTAMGGSSELQPFEATLQNVNSGVLLVYAADISGEGKINYATVLRIGAVDSAASRQAPDLVATKTSGETVYVDSAGGTPAPGEPVATRSDGGLVASERNGEISVNGVLIGSGSLPTLHGTLLDYVDPNGVTVWRLGLMFGKPSLLFTAQHRITSLDADVDGRLVFTDDQTGLWRWDDPSTNVAGPVQMADGYIAAAW